MTAERWRHFFATMAAAGVSPRTLDYKKAFTLEFVDRRIGMRP
jgi:NitT/TauT family transport system substrate-binding protein